MTALSTYLSKTREIQTSGVATSERSYYPALHALFAGVGEQLAPKVVPINEAGDRGAGHPDFLLLVETTKDLRASVEAKPPTDDLDTIIQSDQVRRYLAFYHLCLVTNLRQFALVERGAGGQPAKIMEYTLASDAAAFWSTPLHALEREHAAGLGDFLVNALSWNAILTRPRELAEALARYAREALRRLERHPAATLAPLREALARALGLHFTDEQGEHFFRSSLVQTLFYGLFSAWVVWCRGGERTGEFRWRDAGDYLSLPVMRELFEHTAIPGQLEALDIRKPLEWAEATLRRTAYEPFAAAFDQGDAVNYFYEPFLEAYDPDLRAQLGVWYTPREIIRYQVARVDRLLRDELHLPDGLASDDVIVLDPATGTGGYLLEVLRVIDATLAATRGATRALDLLHAATQRVFGFEILPAPFVIAHLQVAALLADRGAALTGKQRAGVFLTNSLTGWKTDEIKQLVLPEYPALKSEAESAAQVKQRAKILVILGNPPYRAQAGVAEDEEHELLAPYYVGLKARFSIQASAINDLYVRFFRLAERQIAETTGRGIISYISNYSWLKGLSHPIMREHMLQAFDRIWIDNLHGDRIISERTPNGNSCETIFSVRGQGAGIKVGTAIATMVRHSPHGAQLAQVQYRDVWGMPDDQATWGRAERKRAALSWSANLPSAQFARLYQTINPTEEMRLALVPGSTETAYLTWPALDQLFVQQFPGFKTSRDADLISIDRDPLAERMRHYYDPNLDDVRLAQYAPVLVQDASRYEAAATRRELLKTSHYRDDRLVRVAYRPFDDRWLYWEGTTKLLDEKRVEFFEQVFTGNFYLAASTKGRRGGVNLPTLTDKFSSLHLQDPYSLYFPLFIRDVKPKQAGQATQATMFDQPGTQPNITPAALEQMQAALGGAPGELADSLFFHILAVTRAPDYEAENAGALEQDWPRIPISATRAQLAASAALGRRVGDLLRPDIPFTPPPELRALAVPARMDDAQLTADDLTVTVRYGGIGRYDPATGRLWWNDRAFWDHVPPAVWAFTIGGYPVVKKWLDYRHIEKLRRPLRLDEVRYVSEMVRRIAALLALGPDLDANYHAVKAHTLSLNLARTPVFTP